MPEAAFQNFKRFIVAMQAIQSLSQRQMNIDVVRAPASYAARYSTSALRKIICWR